MDEEMDEVECTFTAYEIDLDYEFDAARFFDFSRAEPPLETRRAELWFDSAGSYPPSPFVAKLAPREEILMENVNTSPKPKDVESMSSLLSDSDTEADQEVSARDMNYSVNEGQSRGTSTNLCTIGHSFHKLVEKLPSGLTFYNHMNSDSYLKTQTKVSMKPSCQRTSTLMKPTASQLAKQCRPFQAGDSRSNKSSVEKNTVNCSVENQAAKRQKLDGGQIRKVAGAPQQTSFLHKAPKRVSNLLLGAFDKASLSNVEKKEKEKEDGTIEESTSQAKLRVTIPREPDLETANRAQRTRPKTSKGAENVISTVRRFKALPLNRKILEAPSLLLPKRSTLRLPMFQEFNLRTSQRAMQHSSAASTSTAPCNHSDKALPQSHSTSECGSREPGRLKYAVTSRQDGCSSHSFRALPLDKKILRSKGDIGVFRNSKKEITVPMEFNFQTDKVSNPPIELFNKLSLAPETQQIAGSQSKLPWSTKGSKENRWGCFQQENEVKAAAKHRISLFGGKQIPTATDGLKTQIGPVSSINRSMGIR